MKRTFLFLVQCALLVFSQKNSETKDDSFDYLTFAQHWITTECLLSNADKPDSCVVPTVAGSTWSIHGLCLLLQAFKEQWHSFQSLEQKLLAQWPNIVPDEKEADFWSYEWKKHGECAGAVALLSGEYNYFLHALVLNTQIDVQSMLSKANINPSDTVHYTIDNFEKAVTAATGKHAEIRCSKSSKTGEWYINAVRICVDKSLVPMDCPKSVSAMGQRSSLPQVELCPSSVPIYYPPVQNEPEIVIRPLFGSLGPLFVNNLKYVISWL